MTIPPIEMWTAIASSVVILFGAGGMAVKIRNGRHVTKEFCSMQHKLTDGQFSAIMEGQAKIEATLHEVKAWINKGGVA